MCIDIPLDFVGKIKVIHLGFVILGFSFPLGFVKQMHLIRLGFIRKDNKFLCILKKISMTLFLPNISRKMRKMPMCKGFHQRDMSFKHIPNISRRSPVHLTYISRSINFSHNQITTNCILAVISCLLLLKFHPL